MPGSCLAQTQPPGTPQLPGKGFPLGWRGSRWQRGSGALFFPFSDHFFGSGFPTCRHPARQKAPFPEASQQQRKHPEVPGHPSPPVTATASPRSHHRHCHPAQPPAALCAHGDGRPTAKPHPWGFWGSHADPHLAKPFAIIPPQPRRAGIDGAGGREAAAAPAVMPAPK